MGRALSSVFRLGGTLSSSTVGNAEGGAPRAGTCIVKGSRIRAGTCAYSECDESGERGEAGEAGEAEG